MGGLVKKNPPLRIPWASLLLHQGIVTPEILSHRYGGAGTVDDPYVVSFFPDDPRDPMGFPSSVRWLLCVAMGLVNFSVAFASSAYVSGVGQITRELGGSEALNTLGLSFFVLGFCCGPFVWAPTSEMYGRQYVCLVSNIVYTAFNIAICFAQNVESLFVLRFFAGVAGAAPLTNAGGVLADCFAPRDRGLAMTIYALVPLSAPVAGPVVGGFVVETVGWRWLMGIIAILSGVCGIATVPILPETFAPVLLRRRAETLSRMTGKSYVSSIDGRDGRVSFRKSLATALSRPWLLAIHEPIISLLALFQAVVYGTLYLTFAAFPIVYSEERGWSQGVSGLSFLGVLVGMICSVIYILWDHKRYVKCVQASPSKVAEPESRLPPCCVGGVAIPIGLFWFAWTNGSNVHWIVSIAAAVPFGFGFILITLGSLNYIVDSYTIFAASALAVCVVGRATLGATFPLFTPKMYEALGTHWASSIPAFLSLPCAVFPFVFYRYGPAIRKKCKYAAQVEKLLQQARRHQSEDTLHE